MGVREACCSFSSSTANSQPLKGGGCSKGRALGWCHTVFNEGKRRRIIGWSGILQFLEEVIKRMTCMHLENKKKQSQPGFLQSELCQTGLIPFRGRGICFVSGSGSQPSLLTFRRWHCLAQRSYQQARETWPGWKCTWELFSKCIFLNRKDRRGGVLKGPSWIQLCSVFSFIAWWWTEGSYQPHTTSGCKDGRHSEGSIQIQANRRNGLKRINATQWRQVQDTKEGLINCINTR